MQRLSFGRYATHRGFFSSHHYEFNQRDGILNTMAVAFGLMHRRVITIVCFRQLRLLICCQLLDKSGVSYLITHRQTVRTNP